LYLLFLPIAVNKPVLFLGMSFGKHKAGKDPADYLKWLAKTDLDKDLR
jgi:hypothetical protein